MSRLLRHLTALYGEDTGRSTLPSLAALVEAYRTQVPAPRVTGLSERDAILITYGDQVRAPGVAPLQTLADFCSRYLAGTVSGIHLLPFYPYSSDDGFAVIDYRAVDPALGTWSDIARLRSRFRLMFDAVVNHASAQSAWFQGFLRGDPKYRDYFIVVPEGADVSRVIRPRTLPLFTRVATPRGARDVWTTFSADQVDLNVQNPQVLLEIVEILLFYVAHGAEFIRLDAIAFLWKEFGTTCLHLPQTHHVIQLFRAVLDEVAPHVLLITETNVPHAENLSYFGDGTSEAQMVYNFALPPLTLHAISTGDARRLSRWASGLALPSSRVTFFNFLASHDGIGVNPARGILTEPEIGVLVALTLAHGGRVSFKNNPDGTTSPYELNLNFFDALNDPRAGDPPGLQVDRFMTAQAIMLALVGVPGIYFHSLFGSRGWPEGADRTGQNRTINRERLDLDALESELQDPASRRHQVLARYVQLLRARAAHPAFDPHGSMRVVEAGASVFAVLRGTQVLCLHNVADRVTLASIPWSQIWGDSPAHLFDLITGRTIRTQDPLPLDPYQALWLAPQTG